MANALTVNGLSKWFRLRDHRQRTLRELCTRFLTGRFSQGTAVWALRDVTFAVEHGTTFGIIGHNGAGKSTLLRLLCGLSKPTRGHIVCNGPISGILELGGGFNPNLTGRQNLMTAGILNGLTPSQVKSREEKIIDFAEIDQFIDQPTRTYSSGMYLRLAFAVAIEFEPSILVLDEVLAVGDERFQKKCIERITELKRAGTTLIVTSHSPEQIQTLCDEVLVLEEGQVVMQGDPESALAAYHELLQQRTEARASGVMDSSRPSRLMADQGHRQGTLEASISAVRVYNRNGEPAEKIESGEGLTIKLEYRLSDPEKDLALTLGIFTDTRFKCSEAVVSSVRTSFGAALSCEGIIVCQIKALPLLPGRYFVNVGLYPTDWSYIYDSQWDMHSFHVYTTKRESFHISGAMAMDVTWTSLRKVMR